MADVRRVVFALLVACGLCVASAAGAAVVGTPIGTLGGAGSIANGVNASGTVVGSSEVAGNTAVHAFRWDQASGMRDLGTLGGVSSSAEDVNDDGVVVGWSNDGAGRVRAFAITSPAVGMRDLGTLGGSTARAWAVSDAGIVVGESEVVPGGPVHAFAYDLAAGEMRDLGTLGGLRSVALDVNERGLVVGWSEMADGSERGFVFDLGAGRRTEIGALDGTDSVARALNDDGLVVGEILAPSGAAGYQPFVYDARTGAQRRLPALGGDFAVAYDVSDDGVVIGQSSTTGEGTDLGFVHDLVAGTTSTLDGSSSSVYTAVSGSGTVVGAASGGAVDGEAVVYLDAVSGSGAPAPAAGPRPVSAPPAPAPPAVTADASAAAPEPTGGALPVTGVALGPPLAVAVAAISVGGLLVLVARRPRHRSHRRAAPVGVLFVIAVLATSVAVVGVDSAEPAAAAGACDCAALKRARDTAKASWDRAEQRVTDKEVEINGLKEERLGLERRRNEFDQRLRDLGRRVDDYQARWDLEKKAAQKDVLDAFIGGVWQGYSDEVTSVLVTWDPRDLGQLALRLRRYGAHGVQFLKKAGPGGFASTAKDVVTYLGWLAEAADIARALNALEKEVPAYDEINRQIKALSEQITTAESELLTLEAEASTAEADFLEADTAWLTCMAGDDTCDPPCETDPSGAQCRDLCEAHPNLCRPPDPDPDPDPDRCVYSCSDQGGDPHLVTFDGTIYDFQAEGEFVAVESTVDDFAVHVQHRAHPSGPVAIIDGVAVRSGGDVVVFAQGRVPTANGSPAMGSRQVLAGGTVLEGGTTTAADGTRVTVTELPWRGGSYFDVSIEIAPSRRGLVRGLSGDADGDDADELAIPTGDPDAFYGVWGPAQQTDDGDRLFPGPRRPYAAQPARPPTLDELDRDALTAAVQLCAEAGWTEPDVVALCAYDVAVTGDPGFAGSSLLRRLALREVQHANTASGDDLAEVGLHVVPGDGELHTIDADGPGTFVVAPDVGEALAVAFSPSDSCAGGLLTATGPLGELRAIHCGETMALPVDGAGVWTISTWAAGRVVMGTRPIVEVAGPAVGPLDVAGGDAVVLRATSDAPALIGWRCGAGVAADPVRLTAFAEGSQQTSWPPLATDTYRSWPACDTSVHYRSEDAPLLLVDTLQLGSPASVDLAVDRLAPLTDVAPATPFDVPLLRWVDGDPTTFGPGDLPVFRVPPAPGQTLVLVPPAEACATPEEIDEELATWERVLPRVEVWVLEEGGPGLLYLPVDPATCAPIEVAMTGTTARLLLIDGAGAPDTGPYPFAPDGGPRVLPFTYTLTP